MNWSKAKTILIVALLIADLFIGSYYLSGLLRSRREEQQRMQDAVRYLEQEGISLEAPLPQDTPRLPALMLQFSDDAPAAAGAPAHVEYENVPVVLFGQEDAAGFTITPGEVMIETAPAYRALLRILPSLKEAGVRTIRVVELVYYVAESGIEDASEDTALPHWGIFTDRGIYYEPAFQ